MINRPQIIAIEGSSFTGKTALCRQISEKCHVPYIPEYYHFANKKFPPYPPVTNQDAIDNVQYFANLELRRKHDLDSILSQSNKVVVDRTFLSIIGFQYLLRQLRIGTPSVVEYAKEKMQEMELADEVIKPDKLIVLTVDRGLFDMRLKIRGRVAVDILNDFENIATYASFIEEYQQQNGLPVTMVQQTIESVNSQVQSIIDLVND